MKIICTIALMLTLFFKITFPLYSELPFLFEEMDTSMFVDITDPSYPDVLVFHVQESIRKAQQGVSKLSPDVLKLTGASSPKVRHLLNNLCSIPHRRYLEIGVWMGSTFISSLYNNQKNVEDAVAIDNWSKFGGPKNEFLKNCERFLPKNSYRLFSQNSFSINLASTFKEPINVYFYDGDHSALAQELALTYFFDILDDIFVVVIDDWNRPEIQQGTFNGLKKLNHEILFQTTLPAYIINDAENWWNGLFVAVIRKN